MPTRTAAAAIVAGLLGPPLPGARCAGTAPLHDADLPNETAADRAQRHAQARRVCTRCPALDACRAAAHDLPAGATGVWAGALLGGPAGRR